MTTADQTQSMQPHTEPTEPLPISFHLYYSSGFHNIKHSIFLHISGHLLFTEVAAF